MLVVCPRMAEGGSSHYEALDPMAMTIAEMVEFFHEQAALFEGGLERADASKDRHEL